MEGKFAPNASSSTFPVNSPLNKATVVVVGSGISGLFCAYELRKKGIDVLVVEATNWVGGRIKSLRGLVDWKTLDIGAEFIHGQKSIFKDFVNEHGLPHRKVFTWAQGDGDHPEELRHYERAMYYIGKEKKLVGWNSDHPLVKKTNEVLFNFGSEGVQPGDEKKTFDDWFREKGLKDDEIAFANAGYSNSLCNTSPYMNLKETMLLNNEWERFEDRDFRMENGMGEVIETLAKGTPIKCCWPVKKIDFAGKTIVLENIYGDKVECARVVVTASANVMKSKMIEFIPPLPPTKIKALNQLEMKNGIKIVLITSKRFWPSRLNGLVCSNTPIPEIWFEQPDRLGELDPNSKDEKRPQTKVHAPSYIISGFATSEFAEKLTKFPSYQILQIFREQINEIFGFNKAYEIYESFEAREETNVSDPASKFYVNGLVQDWGKEPYVLGGYTNPSLSTTKETRLEVSKPVADKVFFAGEHTHHNAYMTINGAVETGLFAANRVYESLLKPTSKY